VREWVKRAQADRTKGRTTGLTTAEREELVRLRKALRIAEEERDILRPALEARGTDPGQGAEAFTQTTNSQHDDPIAATVLDRDFTAAAPNQRWVGDTTEFVIGENAKLYLAAILDLYSRFVVGWAISAVNDRRLTLQALEMAVRRRCPEPGLLHRSDRGCTYTCADYQRYLATHGITCSMSRRADCYDNAVMESFFRR
jgi:transposase InsO family protein